MKYSWQEWKQLKESPLPYDPDNLVMDKPKRGQVDQIGLNPNDKAGQWLAAQGMQPNIEKIKQGVRSGKITPEYLAQLQRMFGFRPEVAQQIDPEGYERKRQLQHRIANS